jgi:hypothetical protein
VSRDQQNQRQDFKSQEPDFFSARSRRSLEDTEITEKSRERQDARFCLNLEPLTLDLKSGFPDHGSRITAFMSRFLGANGGGAVNSTIQLEKVSQ